MLTMRLFIRLSHPPLLLIAGLLYFLGCGVAHYLGATIDWGNYWLGQSWLLFLQFMIYALNEYFETPAEQRIPSRTLLTGSSGVLSIGKLPRPLALWASVTSGLATSLLSVLLLIQSSSSLEGKLIMLGMALIGLVFSIPPVRLSNSGYGELLMGIFLTALVPVLSFVLQFGSLHRLLLMITLPLLFLYLALILIVEFPDYASCRKYEKIDLLQRLGWQRGITLHNFLISGGFFLLALSALFGMPWRMILPIMILFPVGIFQILSLNRVGAGQPPNWTLLLILAGSTFGVVAYYLTYSFWTR